MSSSSFSKHSFNTIPKPKHVHSHDSSDDVHHEHKFHIGIFHSLGHVLESIVISDNFTDEHLSIATNIAKVESFIADDFNDNVCNEWNYLLIKTFGVLANPPPDDWSIPKNIQCPCSPLRAPPTVA